MNTIDIKNLAGLEIIIAGILPFLGFQIAGPLGCYFGLMILCGITTGSFAAIAAGAEEDLTHRIPDMF